MTREDAIKTLYELRRETNDTWYEEVYNMAIEALSADAEPKMTEEVREALMRLTMCAREECAMCKYKDKCGFEFQYNISTENMNTLLDALSADVVQGEWIWRTDIPIGDGRTSAGYICSNCGKDYWHGNVFKYCPSCGARMKGGAE